MDARDAKQALMNRVEPRTGFRQTLRRHLDAIKARDLEGLAATIADDELVLIMSDGRVTTSPAVFLSAHRDWFASDQWTLDARLLRIFESDTLGVAVFHLTYREDQEGKDPVDQESHLTLVFERRGDRWVMVEDQNTPLRVSA
jgi:ketosteroid isomerase-like protein